MINIRKDYPPAQTKKEWKAELLKWKRSLNENTKDFWKEEYISDEAYFSYLKRHIINSFIVSGNYAYQELQKLIKRRKGFSEYLETNQDAKVLFDYLLANEIKNAEKEYKEIFKSNPIFGFNHIKSLIKIKEYEAAQKLTMICLKKCKLDKLFKARFTFLLVRCKAFLGDKNIESLIEESYHLFMQHFVELPDFDEDNHTEAENYIYGESFAVGLKITEAFVSIAAGYLSEKGKIELYKKFCYPFAYLQTPFNLETLEKMRIMSIVHSVLPDYLPSEPDFEKDNAIRLMATFYKYLSRYKDAIDEYNKLESSSMKANDLIELAELYVKNNDHDNARKIIEQIQEMNLQDEMIIKKILIVLHSLGDNQKSLELLITLGSESLIIRKDSAIWEILINKEFNKIVEEFEKINLDEISSNEKVVWFRLLKQLGNMSYAHNILLSVMNKIKSPDYEIQSDDFTIDAANDLIEYAKQCGLNTDLLYQSAYEMLKITPIWVAHFNYSSFLKFQAWLNEQGHIQFFVESIKVLPLEFDTKLSTLINLDVSSARSFLEEYKSLLDEQQYREYNFIISLHEKKEGIEINEEIKEIALNVTESTFKSILREAFNQDHIQLYLDLINLRTVSDPIYQWNAFIAYVYQGIDDEAKNTLEKINFEDIFVLNEIDNKLNPIMSSGLSLAVYENIRRIDDLFKPDFPYYKIRLDSFFLLLKKTSDQNIHELMNDIYENLLHEIEEKSESLNLTEEYDAEYKELQIKRILMKRLEYPLSRMDHKSAYAYQVLRTRIHESIMNRFNEIVEKAKTAERNRILSNLSHSIKNILRSVIDPLINLRDEIPEKKVTIDRAIKGANLIREMVNSINLSYKTSIDELVWDIEHAGADAISLGKMIFDSLLYSVGNMFDFRYFPVYAENYFPMTISKEQYSIIENDWKEVVNRNDFAAFESFVKNNMFDISVNIDECQHYLIGNEKSSGIKLMILFQEIIFNAVKYSSFVPREKRNMEIVLRTEGSKIHFEVKNSYNPKTKAKTTGVGKVVIDNFSQVLDAAPIVTKDNENYHLSIEFENIWRKNGKDTLH